MTPVISLVTGTYNRKASLQAMLVSFQRCLPVGITFEVMLVDGGSTDGTIEWAKKQDYIRLIQHGELRGALRAFNDGANAALGDYVLLVNDDIIFNPNSIIPALVHLECNPQCGAVAFADDRPAPGYGAGLKVQTMRITDALGRVIDVPYAQVGMFRCWLGNQAGWWGADDPVMGTGQTYGGDNYLSARIWELGYTVDAVEACSIIDTVIKDDLREHNGRQELNNPGVYYKRYPQPPRAAPAPLYDNPQQERLRVLYLPIYEPFSGHYKSGLREAFQRVGLVYEIDYVNQKYSLPKAVEGFRPHLLLTQCHNADSIPVAQIAAARTIAPEMVAINWNGDVWSHGLTSLEMQVVLKHFDMQLCVNASAVDELRGAGYLAAYWQIAFEPVDEDNLPDVPAHDIVFLANPYSVPRQQLGNMLQSMRGINVGLYGRGWQWANGDTTYNFETGRAIYRKAKIAIGDNQYPDQRGFVSNRLFECLVSGTLLLHQHIAGLEELTGLRDGVHYVSWSTEKDLQDKLHYWLSPRRDSERQTIAQAAREFILKYHSFDARVNELLEAILPQIERMTA